MLIERLFIPAEELKDVGLQTINMPRLGRYVAMTGKNGAGKSRILAKANAYITQRSQYFMQADNLRQQIAALQNLIATHPNNPSCESWNQQIVAQQNMLTLATERVFPQTLPAQSVLYFVPKQLGLIDSRGHAKIAVMNLYHQAKNPGFQGFESACFAYIQKIQDREWAASHQRASHCHFSALRRH
ncbi:hypothetical protein [Sideroxydans sp. CL21]|uniref:hypothetical protein n=1 Tax=Sideroxydans sp. CL21 TaxID=2600596 RepID=UPI0012A860E4|nr:hypothetical protein [Sideroxydans sp. CL21]VVC83969.1 hypothetical protein [Sideroxydans sp. CL21]